MGFVVRAGAHSVHPLDLMVPRDGGTPDLDNVHVITGYTRLAMQHLKFLEQLLLAPGLVSPLPHCTGTVVPLVGDSCVDNTVETPCVASSLSRGFEHALCSRITEALLVQAGDHLLRVVHGVDNTESSSLCHVLSPSGMRAPLPSCAGKVFHDSWEGRELFVPRSSPARPAAWADGKCGTPFSLDCVSGELESGHPETGQDIRTCSPSVAGVHDDIPLVPLATRITHEETGDVSQELTSESRPSMWWRVVLCCCCGGAVYDVV